MLHAVKEFVGVGEHELIGRDFIFELVERDPAFGAVETERGGVGGARGVDKFEAGQEDRDGRDVETAHRIHLRADAIGEGVHIGDPSRIVAMRVANAAHDAHRYGIAVEADAELRNDLAWSGFNARIETGAVSGIGAIAELGLRLTDEEGDRRNDRADDCSHWSPPVCETAHRWRAGLRVGRAQSSHKRDFLLYRRARLARRPFAQQG